MESAKIKSHTTIRDLFNDKQIAKKYLRTITLIEWPEKYPC